MAIATKVAITGLTWPLMTIAFTLGRWWLDRLCRSFLECDFYREENHIGEGTGYYEVDYWLARHPHLTDTVAQWALANGRTLQNRHLWALRAQEGHGPNFNFGPELGFQMATGTSRMTVDFGLVDVLDGALERSMDFHDISQATRTRETAATVRRL